MKALLLFNLLDTANQIVEIALLNSNMRYVSSYVQNKWAVVLKLRQSCKIIL